MSSQALVCIKQKPLISASTSARPIMTLQNFICKIEDTIGCTITFWTFCALYAIADATVAYHTNLPVPSTCTALYMYLRHAHVRSVQNPPLTPPTHRYWPTALYEFGHTLSVRGCICACTSCVTTYTSTLV